MARHRLTSLLLCALLVGSTSCSLLHQPGPDDAFRAFADALQRKDTAAAAASTDDPNAAASTIKAMFDGMGTGAAVKVDVAKSGDDENNAKFDYSWSFGPDKTLRVGRVPAPGTHGSATPVTTPNNSAISSPGPAGTVYPV